MNTHRLHQSFLTALLCATATAAVAQTPPTTSQAHHEVQQQKQDPLTLQGSGGDDWSMLKGHDKGYVTREDAPTNSWLATNFTKCDKDGDGKVTESEYEKCQKPQR
ncbi:MAG TPA: hypothetical protein VGC30_02495 [Dokdonella sp.]